MTGPPEPPAPWPPVYLLPGAASIRQAALYDAIFQLVKRTMWLESVVNTITGDPNPPAWNYLTEAEADLRYPLKTAPDPYPQYLTTGRANQAYLQLTGGVLSGGLTLPQGPLVVDPNPANALVWGPAGLLATGGAGVTDVTINGSPGIGSVESPANTFALSLLVSPDAQNTLALRANGLYGVPTDLSAYSTTTAMNTAISASMTGHTGAADPHPVYATDTDLANHAAAANPHSVYATDADLIAHAGAADPHSVYLNQARGDARYYTQAQADGRYEPFDSAYTKAESDGRYLQPGAAASTYVPLAGGSVLTGSLGPATTNVVDLGTTALRWRKLWGVDTDLSGALNVAGATTFTSAPTVGGSALQTQAAADARYLQISNAFTQATADGRYLQLVAGGTVSGATVFSNTVTVQAKALALSPNANQTLQWVANGLFSDSPTKATVDALTTRVSTLEGQVATLQSQVAALQGQMGSGATGHYHPMGTWRQTAKAVIPVTVLEEVAA